MVIENKIYAGDQPWQLERYHDYLKNTLQLNPGDFAMVYLSPWNQKPSIKKEGDKGGVYAITEPLYKELKNQHCFHEIGYHGHIEPFLENCLNNIQSPKVAETVRQYLQTIQML